MSGKGRTSKLSRADVTITSPSALGAGFLGLLQAVSEDIDTAIDHDPAARSRLEVAATYPGLHAIWLHRIAHALHNRKHKGAARLLSAFNRFVTGVEIHPGATFGRRVFIDHGMGVVIGETAVVGDSCLIYKGVVLGGTSLERTDRHPKLGTGVVVGSNACILGAIGIGDGARVGSGSVVIRDVPEHSTVVGVPGRAVAEGDNVAHHIALDHADLPDPIVDLLRDLTDQVTALRRRLGELELDTLDRQSETPEAESLV